MGILFEAPQKLSDFPYVQQERHILKIETYPLPLFFWAYLGGGIILLFFFILLLWPLQAQLFQSEWWGDKALIVLLWISLILTIIVCLGFLLFHQKWIFRLSPNGEQGLDLHLEMIKQVLNIQKKKSWLLFKNLQTLQDLEALSDCIRLQLKLDSPNMAHYLAKEKIEKYSISNHKQKDTNYRAFQNQGYWNLFFCRSVGSEKIEVLLDCHSRKLPLENFKKMIMEFLNTCLQNEDRDTKLISLAHLSSADELKILSPIESKYGAEHN